MASTQLAQVRDVKIGDYSIAQICNQQLWKDPAALDSVAIVTFPATALDNLPPMHRATIAAVKVDTNESRREIYPVGGGKYGLSKSVIMKMLKAAGASVSTRKTSNPHDLDHVEWSATVEGYTPDGTPHRITSSKAWDWIKCQEQMKEGEAKIQRKFADEITESKAILRAARAFLNIQTSYTKEEMQRPFLIAKSVPDLDPNDPDVKRALIDKALGNTAALYPSMPSLPAGIEEERVDDDEEPETAEFTHEPEPEPAPSTPMVMENAFDEPESGAPKCCNGHEITEVTLMSKVDGVDTPTLFTASKIVDLTLARTGKVMCYSCFVEHKKAGAK